MTLNDQSATFTARAATPKFETVSPIIWNNCSRILRCPTSPLTSSVLRHSFASIGNDLGFTEVTIAALVGHAKGSVTSKYIHTLDTALIIAADTIARLHPGPPRRERV